MDVLGILAKREAKAKGLLDNALAEKDPIRSAYKIYKAGAVLDEIKLIIREAKNVRKKHLSANQRCNEEGQVPSERCEGPGL